MAGITHSKVSGIADGADTDLVRPSDWNASHVVEQVITDNAVVTVDSADAADNDYAKFTAIGVEGRSYAEVLSDLGILRASKTANETVNNSNVLQNDDHLKVALEANKAYSFELKIWLSSGATPDFKYTFTMPSGGDASWGDSGVIGATAVGAAMSYYSVTAPSVVVVAGTGDPKMLFISGIATNGANAGDLQFKWAQNTAHASDTIVYANSLMIATKVD